MNLIMAKENMKQKSLLVIFVLAISVSCVLAGQWCGDSTYCYDDEEYCCDLGDGTRGCCWDEYYIYDYWWFWLIWVFFLVCVAMCSFACWRRRRNQMRYVVMANSQYPAYGTTTTVHTSSHQSVYPSGVIAPAPPAGMPAQPPAYVNKPPAYSYNA